MTLVADASAIAEFLLATPSGEEVGDLFARHAGGLHVPHLAIIESTSVLRGWVRRGEVAASRAQLALRDLADLPAERWAAEPLLPRIWELRDNVSAYDATYLALAEGLDAVLVTADHRLSRAASAHSDVRVIVL